MNMQTQPELNLLCLLSRCVHYPLVQLFFCYSRMATALSNSFDIVYCIFTYVDFCPGNKKKHSHPSHKKKKFESLNKLKKVCFFVRMEKLWTGLDAFCP